MFFSVVYLNQSTLPAITEVEARLLSMQGMPGLSRVREWGGDKPPVREGINPKWGGRRRDFASFEKLRDLFFARRSERNSGFLKFIKKIGKWVRKPGTSNREKQ